ncbi:MAG TPA: hypothetical protein VMF32_10465 [Xanthobacteraceae bacterium]|nr:hypothetical protein [Xanthobacteraceae bacterium]
MKNFAHPSFFHVFDLLLGFTNPGLKHASWTHDGVCWERERHSFASPRHGLAVEIVTLTRPGRRGWSVMVVKEYWWAGKESKALKSSRWAKPVTGQRGDIMQWLRLQEASLDRRAFARPTPTVADQGLTDTIERLTDGSDDA